MQSTPSDRCEKSVYKLVSIKEANIRFTIEIALYNDLTSWSLTRKEVKVNYMYSKRTHQVSKKDICNVPSKGQLDCSTKRTSGVSLKKNKWNVPPKEQVKCPPKRTSVISLKKGDLNVPQKGQVKYPPKRANEMSLENGKNECLSKE